MLIPLRCASRISSSPSHQALRVWRFASYPSSSSKTVVSSKDWLNSGKAPSSICTCATGLKVASKPRSWPICGTGRFWSCEPLGPNKWQLAVAFYQLNVHRASRTSPVCLVLFEFSCSMRFFSALCRTDFEMSIDLALA
jgi:hypothetical protein